MAEAQMMNTIEYRVDCQLLQYLHEENALGFRFPIGKMDQVISDHCACGCNTSFSHFSLKFLDFDAAQATCLTMSVFVFLLQFATHHLYKLQHMGLTPILDVLVLHCQTP